MKIHREGSTTLALAGIVLALLCAPIWIFVHAEWITVSFIVMVVVLYALIFWFFRVPSRPFRADDKIIYAPADGKIVVIEEVDEPEYLKDRRIQISIFMSPLNVHVNYYPVSGKVIYFNYHPGKYLVAWHPKSSTENERATIVLETPGKIPVLIRQIAGAVARRVVTYSSVNQDVLQGNELGFIKFGSRVDLFLPLNAKINVSLNQSARSMRTAIAELE